MKSRYALRVHIAPVGFEVLRVIEPLIQLRADRVHLVTGSPHDAASRYWDEIKNQLKRKYPLIEPREVFADPWGLPELLVQYQLIIKRELDDGNQVFVNVSTGTKVTAMAGLLASMLWGSVPYYVSSTTTNETETVHRVTFPPVYRITPPRPEELEVLEGLRQSGAPTSKERLIRYLRSVRVFPREDEISDPAVYNRLRVLLSSLTERGFVSVEGERTRARVSLTNSGREALAIFRPKA